MVRLEFSSRSQIIIFAIVIIIIIIIVIRISSGGICSGLCFESKLQQAATGFKVKVHPLQVSYTFLNVLAVPNNAVFSTRPTLKSVPNFSIHLSNSFDTAPSAPMITGMTIIFYIPHMVATSLFKPPYF